LNSSQGVPSPQRFSFDTGNVHGSAHWMTPNEAAALRLDDPAGVVLGQRSNGQFIRFNGDGHLMVFAPTGAGKGIGFVQPNLIEYRGSMVVLDPKGENAIVGAAYRRDVLKQRVIVLDPFGMTDQKSDTYNPLGALTFADGANVGPWIECLADAIIPSQSEKDKHWTDGAKRFVGLLMWWMVAHEPPEKRNLVRFYELASGGRDLIYKIATVMSEGRSQDVNIARECRAKGNWFLDRQERELSYFESVGSNYFSWIGDAVWAGVLGGPPSPPLPLKTLPKGMTVFLVLPFHRMERYQSWLRLMVADLLSSLYEVQGAPDIPVLFLLDEAFAGLGRMPTLTKAAAGVRSAGARLCFIYQDVGQVNELYGNNWQTFVANSGATLFWSVNDLPAAQFISTRCGTKTTPVPGSPAGMAEQLIRVEALSTLPADEIIALFRNSSPAKFGRLDVRKDARFSGLAPNKTYGKPVEKTYTARTDFVPVDLAAVVAKKRTADDDFEAEAAPIAPPTGGDRGRLVDISERTGMPLAVLERKEAELEAKLILRGAELGYLDDRGMFVCWIAAGD
jgi:type IV secretion system protein VirD4